MSRLAEKQRVEICSTLGFFIWEFLTAIYVELTEHFSPLAA